MDINYLLKERAKTHGDFNDFSEIAQALKAHIPDYLEPLKREALEMIFHKASRIINGDSDHIDHWADMAGYSTLVANILRGKND